MQVSTCSGQAAASAALESSGCAEPAASAESESDEEEDEDEDEEDDEEVDDEVLLPHATLSAAGDANCNKHILSSF